MVLFIQYSPVHDGDVSELEGELAVGEGLHAVRAVVHQVHL